VVDGELLPTTAYAANAKVLDTQAEMLLDIKV
jgi:hypothetical protein